MGGLVIENNGGGGYPPTIHQMRASDKCTLEDKTDPNAIS